MPTVIAIGASAGGQRALTELLQPLPADFPAAFLVAVHLPPHGPSHLSDVLARHTALRVLPAAYSDPVQEGTVYVAVPDRHLMLVDGRIRLTRGPRENHSRPSIDVLFRSCASSLGSRAIGVLLTGGLDDGTAGLWTIKDAGGQVIVQTPEEAEFASMPRSAIDHVAVDHIVRIAELPAIFRSAVKEALRRAKGKAMSDKLKAETQIAEGVDAIQSGSLELGPSTELTCPECGGVLAQIEEGSIIRFRCHTGHAYSSQTLTAETDLRIEHLLWGALRGLDERTLILLRRAASAKATASAKQIEEWQREIRENRKRAAVIRELIMSDEAAKAAAP